MKLIHCADLHLDSRMESGLPPEKARERRMELLHTPGLNQKKWTVRFSRILCVSIILSTMFIKQHSCIDVIFAILLGVIINYIVYHTCFLVKAHDFVGKFVRKHRYFTPSLAREIHSASEDAEI